MAKKATNPNDVTQAKRDLVAIRVLEQAEGRLRRIAKKRADADVKAAWIAAADILKKAARK
jgi:hypothetical protein